MDYSFPWVLFRIHIMMYMDPTKILYSTLVGIRFISLLGQGYDYRLAGIFVNDTPNW